LDVEISTKTDFRKQFLPKLPNTYSRARQYQSVEVFAEVGSYHHPKDKYIISYLKNGHEVGPFFYVFFPAAAHSIYKTGKAVAGAPASPFHTPDNSLSVFY